MSERYSLPDYEETDEAPPPYTPTDPIRPQQQQHPTIKVDSKSKVFHKGARFNEFAKPLIPPPPPGCAPNHFQQMQMEKGQLEVIITSSAKKEHHYENHGFSDGDS